ncbi:MAG: pitrilysin family protein [Saprospiraceae bacterium]
MKVSLTKSSALRVSGIKPKILPNNARFYSINRGAIPALKLELTFPAGRPFEKKQGVAAATLLLLKGGTKSRSATKLAEGFDQWGSSINFDFYIDTVGIKLYTLEKYLPKALALLIEQITEPSFPLPELKLYQRQQKEKLRSDETRGDVIAYRTFTEHLFGSYHPYGYNSTIASIDALTQADLRNHFQDCYQMSSCNIFLSGGFSDVSAELVKNSLGSIISAKYKFKKPKAVKLKQVHGEIHIQRSDAIQTSIRIGRTMFSRNHPDFVPMYVFNTILGGYYGSKLMQNLREKKGLTYHIYSSMDTFMMDGYFLISTEVDKERTHLAITAIYKEIEKLKTKLISTAELASVKNYLMGNFLNYLENAFGYSELVRMMSLEGGSETYNQLVEGVEKISSKQILEVANKYFQEKDLSLVTVGQF